MHICLGNGTTKAVLGRGCAWRLWFRGVWHTKTSTTHSGNNFCCRQMQLCEALTVFARESTKFSYTNGDHYFSFLLNRKTLSFQPPQPRPQALHSAPLVHLLCDQKQLSIRRNYTNEPTPEHMFGWAFCRLAHKLSQGNLCKSPANEMHVLPNEGAPAKHQLRTSNCTFE